MRTITAAERAAIASLQSGHWFRLEIWDSTSTYLDYSTQLRGVDFTNTFTLEENIDTNSMQFSATLLREAGTLSLSPFMSASLLNQVGGSYATLLDLWRKFRLSVACMRQGYPPTGADWKELCVGRVDTIDTSGDRIAITGRDEGAVLLDKYIDTARTYGSGGGIAMETVIQTMLDDNNTGVTLYCPVSPGYLMNSWTQPKDRLMTALQAVADKAGFVLKYRYDSASTLRLTLYQPNRTASVEDWSMGPSEYTAVPLNKIDIQGVRNFIKLRFAHPTLGTQTVIYPHMVGTGTVACTAGAATFSVSQAGLLQSGAVVIVAGIPYSVSGFNGTTLCTLSTQPPDGVAPGVPTFTATAFTLHGTLSGGGFTTSLSRFGRRDLEIDLAFTSQVNDATKAQAMADAIGADTEFPNLEQQFETSCAWFVQLHDYGKFLANRIHYDTDQLAGVSSVRHEGQNGYIKTTIGAKGKPAGKYTGWRFILGTQTQVSTGTTTTTFAEVIARVTATTATTVTVTVTANPASPPQQVQLAAITGSATLNSGTAVGTWVTPNGTNNVWVFNRGAINAGVGQVQFKAGNTFSSPNDDDFVAIEEQGRDTVYLIMRAEITAITANDVTIRVRVADPFPLNTISVAYVTTGIVGVNLTSPQTISSGITNDITTTNFVDFIVTRGTGTGAGRITFTATSTARATDSDAVDIPPARVTGGGGTPTLSSPDSFWNGTNSITGTDTAGRITLDKSTTSSSQHSGHQIKVTFAVAYPSAPFVLLGVPNKFTSNLHFEIGTVTATDFWIDANADVLLVNGTVAEQKFVSYAVIG